MGRIKCLGVIGLGLLGGSVAAAAKKRRAAIRIVGYSRRASTVRKALKARIVDEGAADPETVVRAADILVIATPPSVLKTYLDLVAKIKPSLTVTDVASVKTPVVRAAASILGKKNNFVGSHPIAGSERSGVEAASADLFQKRIVIITPATTGRHPAVDVVASLWRTLGATVVFLSPGEHDELLCLTSHLPHLAAFALTGIVARKAGDGHLPSCIGSGFRDTTRIAASSPELWTEIFLENRVNLLRAAKEYRRLIQRLETAIASGNERRLRTLLEQWKQFRENCDATT